MWQPNEIITTPSREDYCLTQILREGGFATIYLATQFSDDDQEKYIAIKVFDSCVISLLS